MKLIITILLGGTVFATAQPGWLYSGVGSNIASQATVIQSSEVSPGTNSIDGDTNTFSMTEWGRHAFIELSFKETNWFDNVRIWPRPGAERFGTNFFIFVSDLPFTSTSTNVRFDPGVSTYGTEFSGPVGNIGPYHSRFAGQGPMVERLGRYIRIQLAGDGELAVGDVSVIGYRHEGPVLFLIQTYARVRTNDVWVDGRQDRLVIRGTVSNATWQIERRADLTSPWALIAEVRATNSIQRWHSQPYIPDPAGFFRTREKLISLP